MNAPLITARATTTENGLGQQLPQPDEEGGDRNSRYTSCSSDAAAAAVAESSEGQQLPQPEERGGDHNSRNTSCSSDAAAAAVAVSSEMWVCLAVSVAISLASGSQYGFGRYVLALKETLGLTQPQAARLGSLLDAGNYLGHPITGALYDYVGPRGSCSLAALLVGMAYGGVQLIVNRGRSPSSLWVLEASFFVVGFGSGLGYIAALGSTSKQFADTAVAGRAVGVVAAGFGLSGTFVALTYGWVDLQHFFALWAVLVAVVNIIGAVGLKNPRNDSSSMLEVVGASSSWRHSSGNLAVANESILHQEEEESNPQQSYQRLPSSSSPGSPGPVEPISNRSNSNNNIDLSWTSWKRLDYWLLFTGFACLTGCGLFLINNLATIVQSFENSNGGGDGGDSLAGSLVIVCSVCNCFGRLFMGVLVDKTTAVASRRISLMQSAAFVMSAGLAVTATAAVYTVHRGSGDAATTVDGANVAAPPASLLLSALAVTVVLTAVSYGAVFVVTVAILTEQFGSTGGGCAKGKHFGKDYGLILVGSALFGAAGNAISAWMYQQQAESSSNSSGADGASGDICLGAICYRGSFLLATVIAFCGGLLLQVLKLQRHS